MPAAARHMRSDTAVAITAACTALRSPSEVSLVTTAPAHTSPTDDPGLYNLTWTYNGTSPISGAAALGDFSVVADTNQLTTKDFAALATRSNDPTNTNTQTSNTNVSILNDPGATSTVLIVRALQKAVGQGS